MFDADLIECLADALVDNVKDGFGLVIEGRYRRRVTSGRDVPCERAFS
jgi:hypothetical protein